jgi:hypothetical protein
MRSSIAKGRALDGREKEDTLLPLMRLVRRAVIALLCPLLFASPSRAAGPPAGVAHEAAAPAKLADALLGDAKIEYERAALLFRDGDYAGALAKYARAFELSGDARLLWNMAACQKALRHYFQSSKLVERYLNEAGPALDNEWVARAEETLAALRDLWSPLTVDVRPAGARVLVDDVELTVAGSAEAVGVDLGLRRLRVEAPGYEPYTATLDVPGRTPVKLTVTLVRPEPLARLDVAAESGAEIAIDGRALAVGRWEGDVAPGAHRVRVTLPGKLPYESDVQLAGGARRTMQITLRDRPAPVWPWIVGGAVVAAGAAVGAYFLLKPSAEVDPVPTGSLGKVTVVRVGGS